MKRDFLLEILVQELPYKFIPSAIEQLEHAFEKLFCDNKLNYDEIKVYATPRRLAVLVYGLEQSQKDLEKEIKGPILSIAKNQDGTLSPAAIGFAKKNGVDVASLYEKDNYIYAHVQIKGKSAKEILQENCENIILKLQGSHFMRWGEHVQKFSRPIENVVALLDNEIVELKIIDKVAHNSTQGHRYSLNRNLVIDEVRNYVEILKTGNVIVNQDERKNLIIENATKCAHEQNLYVDFDKMRDLLEEITYITEYPVAVMCEFDKKYLQIPSIVTVEVMTSHQRYFPLWDEKGNLSNKFITMTNYVGSDFSNIQAGNQRVITARLEDGIFFYQEDTKTKLIDKLDNLKGMTFQKGLGTLFDKTERIVQLSEIIADYLKIENKQDILRCAKLSKCDLSTKLVFEFTELQGFIGENYALKDKEPPQVAKGIAEHYFPLNANSELADDIIGQIVSIADKIDTICALFISTQKENKKKRPSGSNDPLGARRAAIGILRTVIEKKLNINLEEIIKKSLAILSAEFSLELEDTIITELREFFVQRLLFMYEKDFSVNTINSISNFNPLVNVFDFIKRAKIIEKYKNNETFAGIKENATRVLKIVKITDKKVDENLFVFDEEHVLYNAILNHDTKTDDLEEYIKSLSTLNDAIYNFFEKVLVMDKDEQIKNNRLALLGLLKEKFDLVCDFEKL